MYHYVCPSNVLICLLAYVQKDCEDPELVFNSPYDNCSWKDIDFAIFPIFDGNNNVATLGYVIHC